MTCASCHRRPARLSNRSQFCIICKLGTKNPRLRKRKLSGNEREQQRRLLLRLSTCSTKNARACAESDYFTW